MLPLLRVEKNAHEPARRIAENAAGRGVNLAVNEFEAVHDFRFALSFSAASARRESLLCDGATSAMRCSSVRVMRKIFRMCV